MDDVWLNENAQKMRRTAYMLASMNLKMFIITNYADHCVANIHDDKDNGMWYSED